MNQNETDINLDDYKSMSRINEVRKECRKFIEGYVKSMTFTKYQKLGLDESELLENDELMQNIENEVEQFVYMLEEAVKPFVEQCSSEDQEEVVYRAFFANNFNGLINGIAMTWIMSKPE